MPRLGFFVKNETRIPFDFHEILAAVAPRPLLVVAPRMDQYASFPDIQYCMAEVDKVYNLYRQNDKVELFAPEDYNRFSEEMMEKVIAWIKKSIL